VSGYITSEAIKSFRCTRISIGSLVIIKSGSGAINMDLLVSITLRTSASNWSCVDSESRNEGLLSERAEGVGE
jgi:hypothetical protein